MDKLEGFGYVKAKLFYKLRIILPIFIIIGTVVSLVTADFAFPKISTPESITIEYLDEIPLNDFTIKGSVGKIEHKSAKKLKNIKYDRELVNEWQDAEIKSGFSSEKFALLITPKKLQAPIINIKDEVLIINEMEYVESFEIYIDDNIVATQQLNYSLEYLSNGYHQIKVRYLAPNKKFINSDFSNEINIKKINDVETISYDGTKLMWPAIESAEKYEVIINGLIIETMDNFLNYSLSSGMNNVEIRAININDNLVLNSNYKDVEFLKLHGVSNITFENGRISWESPETNYSYLVIVNKKEYIVDHNYLDIILSIGSNNISVQTIDENNIAIASNINTTQIIYNKLAAPSLSIIESEDSSKILINLKSVKDADVYNLYVKKYIDDTVFNQFTFPFNGDENIEIDVENYVKFEIYADACHSLKQHETSDYSATLVIKKLGAVKEINYDEVETKITWLAVANASKYEVIINGTTYETSSNEFAYDLQTGVNEIKIKALGNKTTYLNSSYSNKKFNKLADVKNISYSNGRISWESLEINYSYRVIVNKKEYIVDHNYLDIILSIGSNNISVQTIDESNNAFASNVNSTKISYNKLAAPAISIIKSEDPSKILINLKSVKDADVYNLYVKKYSNDTVFNQVTLLSNGNENIKIDVENYVKFEIYADACHSLKKHETSDYSATLIIKKLSTVNQIEYEDGKITWQAVAHASKYEVVINGFPYETKNNEISYNLLPGKTDIKIRALGNDTNYLNSDYNNKEFNKLADVTNILYSENRISWDSSENGYQYRVIVNYNVTFVTSNKYIDITLSGNSNNVQIQVFDEDNVMISSNIVNERIGEFKLESPTIKVEVGLIWSSYKLIITPVEHADSYEISIILYAGETIQLKNEKTISGTLEEGIVINAATTKISVSVVAKDSSGLYSNSNLIIKEINL